MMNVNLLKSISAAALLTALPALAFADGAQLASVSQLQSEAASAKRVSACHGSIGNVTLHSAGAPGAPNLITFGADGRLWLSDNVRDSIKATTTSGVVTEYPLTVGAQPADLVLGPDGRVWFAETGGNKIGAISSAGAITEFAIPTEQAIPIGITVGVDGNLWFTEALANKVAKITTAGVITEFSLPTANSFPAFITVSVDGNLWVANGGTNTIDKVTTAGVVTEFPLPAGVESPGQLTPGFDGKVWFTTATGVAKISSSGVVTAFPIAGITGLADISLGPDGDVWTTDPGSDTIYRVNTQGAATPFTVPAGTTPNGITFAPFASCDVLSLWFTGAASNTIGQVRAITVN